ncbi:MAG: hypothetical protein KGJ88_09985 [Verrucomicrobiota bacterium]|nr:hypothetical protein [Verrucomicrobiota bacterium]
MKKTLQFACFGLLTGGWMLLSTGCVGEFGVYGPGPGIWYDYDYYPAWNVYYYPEEHEYYWNEEGEWHEGAELPEHYHLRGERHEHLRFHTQQPWRERER